MKSPLRALARVIRNAGPQMTPSRGGGLALLTKTGNGPLSMMEAVSTVFAVVSRLANSTARVDWKLYRSAASGKDEDRVEVTQHAALDLWRTPNAFFTRQDLVEVCQQHIELTGKAYVVVSRSEKFGGRGTRFGDLPIELWPVRPDRIGPQKDPAKYQTGWVYTDPDGHEIPLRLDEVICLRTPHPSDPYDGLSPVQSLMTDLDSARYSAMWNRNFFINGAQPGGIVTVDRRLSDDEFDEMSARWREQHQGVANAHRVAILEQATYTETKITQRDMEFVALRNISREMIREAWCMPKFALGDVDDVNRATAEASSDWFGAELSTPRLERWKSALNVRFLPMYGTTGQGLEWDYEPVVSEDQVAANEDLAARVDIARALRELGVEWPEALKVAGLPDMPLEITAPEPGPDPAAPGADTGKDEDRALVEAAQKLYLAVGVLFTAEEARSIMNRFGARVDPTVSPKPEEPPAAAPAEGDQQSTQDPGADDTEQGAADQPADTLTIEGDAGGTLANALGRMIKHEVRRGTRPRNAIQGPEDIDLSALQADWQNAVDRVLASWGPILQAQREELITQIRAALNAGDITALSTLSVDTSDATEILLDAMTAMAMVGARHVVQEAEDQDVPDLEAKSPTRESMRDSAKVTVALLARELAVSAGREALRVRGPKTPTAEVVDAVTEHLESLSDATPRLQLGSALTGAQNSGRIETLRSGPVAALYASEQMDTNTCVRCKEINGRWIGNSDDGTVMAEVDKLYPNGGYVDCLGRNRCRGTVTGVWRPKQTGGDQA